MGMDASYHMAKDADQRHKYSFGEYVCVDLGDKSLEVDKMTTYGHFGHNSIVI